MKIGIVGRPHVGKTTVFNALARSNAEIGGYTGNKKMNLSTVPIPDDRLSQLVPIFGADNIINATIDYVDGGGTEFANIKTDVDSSNLSELDSAFLAELRTVDSLAHVVRIFEDDSIPHVDGTIDPERDIDTVNIEFIMSDLQIILGRLERLEKQLKNQKTQELLNEFRILEKCKDSLEEGIPLRSLTISENDEKIIRGYGFLTLKPLLIICNIGEKQLQYSEELINPILKYEEQDHTAVIVLAAQLEMEIAQLDAEDAAIFLSEMGLNNSALDRFIHTSYNLMGLITFFTGGPKEVRAWTLKSGQTAVEAAGLIHTDFAQGFIRAECINWKDLVSSQGFTQAKNKGMLRAEGKAYIVQEGDVINILANAIN
ncbi:redox-regulated ATPase YchF [Candidatus Poribacteria bacterium]|nr:MAG: redox-regulated ATPase YchF [Candidatus Poribacteria bacterium]